MKTSIFFFCLILFFSSCKRESPAPENLPEINLMKAWYVKKVNPQTLQKANILDGNEKILWDKSVYRADNNYFEIPILNNRNFLNKFSKKLIIQRITDSDYKGRIEVVLSKETLVMNTPVLQKYFTGAVINYDLNENDYCSIHYENGEVTGKTDKLTPIASKQINNPDPNNPPQPSCDEGIQVCIDWYWQTFINGELVDEQYLYTTCECGGGGGGGGGGGNVNACTEAFINFLSAGHTVNGAKTQEVISETTNNLIVRYTWQIYSAYTWFISSHENATLDKWYIMNPDGSEYITKKFTSFNHSNISASGSSLGGNRTFNDLGATINFGEDQVGEIVHFSVIHTPLCIPGTNIPPATTIEYNTSGTFVANRTVLIQY